MFFMPDDEMDFTVVVGKNMKLPKIENPTKEDIDKYHCMYVKRIKDLFDKFKGKYAAQGENVYLEIS